MMYYMYMSDSFVFRIYLIDHAWTYRVDKAREQLETIPGLLDRILNLMDIEDERRNDDPVEQVL